MADTAKDNPTTTKLPTHIAIIMDGNGRWAQSRGLPRVAGHQRGGEVLKQIVRHAGEIGIRYLTVYAFSTENWKRPQAEVNALFKLLVDFCKNQVDELVETGTRLRFLGDIDGMPLLQRSAMRLAERKTEAGQGLNFNVCINYGSRQEIVAALRRIIDDGLTSQQLTADVLASYLYTADMPDPDLIIRSSGELRLSNFLLWQSAYAEIVISELNWPDFTAQVLDDCIAQYAKRHRRYGAV